MISSYTANLAAFLTIERMENPIASAEDLAAQTKIRYGAVATGSTAAFFADSADPTFSKMGRVMHRDRDEVMVASNQAGVDKVLAANGEYAFFMESTSIEYQVDGRITRSSFITDQLACLRFRLSATATCSRSEALWTRRATASQYSKVNN